MSNTRDFITLLEEKAIALKQKLQSLEQENGKLRQSISTLQSQQKALQDDFNTLKAQNEALRVANRILGSKEHSKQTKQKINALIKEIDACIVQLSK